MRKGSDLIGKPIVAFGGGQRLETIQDVIFDQESNRLLGFVVDEGGWFSGARVLPLQNVQALGEDAVIVPSAQAITSAEALPAIRRILERNNVLKGTKILTTDGRDLGTMSDLYFDERTGAIEGYEVSGGIFADVASGRAFVPAPQTLKIGKDVAFVPPETATLMEEQTGGLKAAVETAGDTRQDAAASATSATANRPTDPAEQRSFMLGKVASTDVSAPDGTLLVARGQQVTELAAQEAERQHVLDKLYLATGGQLLARTSGAVAGTSIEQARGRRARQAVRTAEGLIIVAPGQVVTEQVINRARTYNKEHELLAAVGLSTSAAAGGQLESAADQAGERLRAGAQDAKQQAGNLWERVKEKVSTMQERTAQELEERRIRDALGRPVGRVILDPQDNVILNLGELITHKAVADARGAQILDMLLDSVADVQPDISQAQLRVNERGRDALPEQEQPAGQQ